MTVVLRLFTGPHMGAELVLEPGEFVLGSSLDCDIVLHDSSVAPQHLKLLVKEGPASVLVFPLMGTALVAGEALAAEAELPARTPCFVGLTCMAWASPDAALGAALDAEGTAPLDEMSGAVSAATPGAEDAEGRDEAGAGAQFNAGAETGTDSVLATTAEDAAANAVRPAPQLDLRAAWDEVNAALRPLLHPVAMTNEATNDARAAEAHRSDMTTASPEGTTADNASAEGALAKGAAEGTQGTPNSEENGEAAPDASAPAADGAATAEATTADAAENASGAPANTVHSVDGSTANNAVLNRLPDIAVQHAKSRRIRRVVIGGLLLLAMSGLIFKTHDELNKPAQSIEPIKSILDQAGFSSLEVSDSDKGPRISGRLPDDAERGRLVRLVQRMQLPVYLNVQVDGDMTQALLTAFNSRELFPEVRADRDGEQITLHVSGYMKDGVVEAWALAGAREDLAWLDAFLREAGKASPGTLTRSIRHADEVDLVLQPALQAARLDKAKVNYLPGTIEISGEFDVDARQHLDRVLADVRQRLGVPIVFQIREDLPRLPQPVAGKSTGLHPDKAPPAETATPAPRRASSPFRVTGVTMTPMRFITLESGERIFEGGTLPGGQTLESISQTRLILRRDGHTTTLPLRDADGQ